MSRNLREVLAVGLTVTSKRETSRDEDLDDEMTTSGADVQIRNRKAVENLIECWNRGDLSALMDIWSPDMVHYDRDGKAVSGGNTGFEMQRFLGAFPDLHMDLENILCEGDMVSTRIRMRATHSGSYLGAQATGKVVTCRLMGNLRFEDGKVVEHWGVADGLALLVQIGLVPEEMLAATA